VGLLGSLTVGDDSGRALPIAAPKERAVLARLGLQAASVVTAGELISVVWGPDPPRSAANT
jgi:DNA-binding SARP family transcriptional activator